MSPENRNQFERYVRMILKGQNDITYRAYDVEAMAEADNRIWCYKYAGLIPNDWDSQDSECNMAALKLQRDLLYEFGVIPYERIDQLVMSFWPYSRIKGHYRKGKKRPPEDVQRLYMQHLESVATEAASSLDRGRHP